MDEYFKVPVVKPYSRSEPALLEPLVYLLDHQRAQHCLSWGRLAIALGL